MRLLPALQRRLAEPARQVAALGRTLEIMSYKNTLKRGYAVVHGPDGLVTQRAVAETLSAMEIEFADGKLSVGQDGAPQAPKPKPKPKKSNPEDSQGSLF